LKNRFGKFINPIVVLTLDSPNTAPGAKAEAGTTAITKRAAFLRNIMVAKAMFCWKDNP
jgi:hypothetical protein